MFELIASAGYFVLLFLAATWIFYRLFVEKEFLFWNWSTGKVRYIYSKRTDDDTDTL